MATLKSRIELEDKMSNKLADITSAADKMTSSISAAEQQLSASSKVEEQLSAFEKKHEIIVAMAIEQGRVVADLEARYAELLQTRGKEEKITQKVYQELLKAQLAEVTLVEKADKFVEVLNKQEEKQKKVTEKIDNAVEATKKQTSEQDNVNASFKRGADEADKVWRKVKGLLATYISFRAIVRGFKDMLGRADELQQQEAVFNSLFGNADVAKYYFDSIQKFSAKTGKSIEDLTDVTSQFMQFTKNTNKLKTLTDLANRLSIRNKSITSSADLLAEAIAGRTTRLKKELKLTDSQMEPLEKAIKRGNLDGITEAFDNALNQAGLTKKIAAAVQETPIQKLKNLGEAFKNKLGQAGSAALKSLEPLIDRFSSWMNSDSGQQFFNNIAFGISSIVQGLVYLFDLIKSNWNVVEPILIAIVTMYLANMAIKIWDNINAFVNLVAMNPKIFVIAAIIFVIIAALIKLGVKTEQITGFIGGLFSALYAHLYNGIAFTWNSFASLAEFLVNLFIDPCYAIEKLFYDLSMNVLKYFNNAINGILSGLNWVVEKMNKLLGTKLESVQVDFVENIITKLEEKAPYSDKNVWSAARMEFKDYNDEINKGYQAGLSLPGKINNALDNIQDLMGKVSSFNASTVDTLGSIDDSSKKLVNKSEEDLKWLRDVAEQEAINRFTTATLAPQLQVTFGDIRETADVDGIIDRLGQVLVEQLNVAAEGVHS